MEKLELATAMKQAFGGKLQETIRKEKEDMGPEELPTNLSTFGISIQMKEEFVFPAGKIPIRGSLRHYSDQKQCVADHLRHEDTVVEASGEDHHLEQNGSDDPSLTQDCQPRIGDSQPTTSVDANQSHTRTSQVTGWSHVQETLPSHHSDELSSTDQDQNMKPLMTSKGQPGHCRQKILTASDL